MIKLNCITKLPIKDMKIPVVHHKFYKNEMAEILDLKFFADFITTVLAIT